MVTEWRESTWGEEISLEYGKGLRGYTDATGPVRVYGTNGPVGWTDESLAPGPGVIVGRKGAYRGVHYSFDPFFVIDTAYYVAPKRDVCMRWLYYAIIHHKLTELNDGSPIPSTTRAAVYVRDVSVPPFQEQCSIAEVLGSLDDKIEVNRRMNRALEEMARAIFKAWFVDFEPVKAKAEGAIRFPGMPQAVFDELPDTFEENEFGLIPTGWETVPLYDTATFVNGAAFKAKDFCGQEEGLPVVKIAELKNGITAQTKFSARDLDANRRIDTGDMLYSWSGSPETSLAVFIWMRGEGLLNQHIFKVITTSAHQKHFVYYLLKHMRDELVHIAKNKQTTGLGHVTVADMKRLRVCRPPEPLLELCEEVIGLLFDQSLANDRESLVLAQTRDTQLPKLISGEVRVLAAKEASNG